MRPFFASKTPKELRDYWGTPQFLFDQLNAEFHFWVDAAATEFNSKCCRHFEDGLAFAWHECVPPGRYVWNNPPFSDVGPWVDQWILAQQNGIGVVSIVNSQTGAHWYHKAMQACSELRLSIGRVAFIDPVTGKATAQNNLGQTVFVMDPLRIGTKILGDFHAREVVLKS